MKQLKFDKNTFIKELDVLKIIDLWLYNRLKRNFRVEELKTMERQFPNKGGRYV